MRPEALFDGKWAGEGVVLGPFGRPLRRFTVAFDGVWSEPHRAFHVDETVVYATGALMERRWVIHTDEQGSMIGADALQAARMRVEAQSDGFSIRFDRPRGLVQAPATRKLTMRFVAAGPDGLIGSATHRVLGLPLLRTRLDLTRVHPS